MNLLNIFLDVRSKLYTPLHFSWRLSPANIVLMISIVRKKRKTNPSNSYHQLVMKVAPQIHIRLCFVQHSERRGIFVITAPPKHVPNLYGLQRTESSPTVFIVSSKAWLWPDPPRFSIMTARSRLPPSLWCLWPSKTDGRLGTLFKDRTLQKEEYY